MRNLLVFTTVALMTAIVLAGIWTSLLGTEGMKVFWTCVLCALTLGIASGKNIAKSPWAILCGVFVSGLLLNVSGRIVPESNLGYGSFHQGTGLTLSEASCIQNFALYGTVLMFAAYLACNYFESRNTQKKSLRVQQAKQ